MSAALDMIEMVELLSVELLSVGRVAQGWSARHVGIGIGIATGS